MKVLALILAAVSMAPAVCQIPITDVVNVASNLKAAEDLNNEMMTLKARNTQSEIQRDVNSLGATLKREKEAQWKDRGSEFYEGGNIRIAYHASNAPDLLDIQGVDSIPKGFGDPFVKKNSIQGNAELLLSPKIVNLIAAQGITSNVVPGDITADEFDPQTYVTVSSDIDCSDPCECLDVLGGQALVDKCKVSCGGGQDLAQVLTCAELEAKGRKVSQVVNSLMLEVELGRGPGLLIKDTHPLNVDGSDGSLAAEMGTYRLGGRRK
mmetsp:Transcript_9969/g.12327  ORF Transcript_9969/g.12327 Transcript_9969/m.12327 type:complete len:266 (+) Transcript_9969:132-929(+)|eukprot:CAMPEP_0172487814 /NCGR_PEP_ID=MMETSP1066-20121228/17056_1 /TAXON_ID=671091 /ORGANISM="Coscinodiscus wailesii, Strain CCMP2513" /LENGTH=265 /DNA_ID=CAMNT_0013254661 /DNA_START=130 /DNA_END=927 /DNA_ORIENTATION=-